MKSIVILLALATVAYGFVVPEKVEENIAVTDKTEGKPKFTVEILLKVLWFVHQHRCNGALIDHSWVLVPAQCVQNKPIYGNFEVSIGSTLYDLSDIIVHPRSNNIANDIALVRLATPVTISDTVEPINLPFPYAEYTETAILYKRGSTGDVQVASLEVKSRVECTDAPGPVSFLHICAGDRKNSAVKGDEGASLTVSDGLSGHVLIGLLSFAKPEPAPAVFTKVSIHTDWILAVLENKD